MDEFNRVISSNIGRIVAFVLTPILLPVIGAIAYWLQDKLGVNLDPQEAVAYIVTVVGGVAAVIFKWLSNRGEWETTIATIEQLHAAGKDANDAD